MSTDLVSQRKSLEQAIAARVATLIESDAAIANGKALAESLRGIVIQSESDAAAMADNIKVLANARKAIEAIKKEASEIPKALVNTIATYCDADLALLKAGRESADSALLAYDRQRREAERLARIQREQEAQRLAAEERARRAEAAASGVDAAEDVVPLEAPTADPKPAAIRGGAGQAVFSSTLCCELVNQHECDPAWLKLDSKLAQDYFRYQVRIGETPEIAPEDEAGIVLKGVRFWRKRSVAAR